MRRTKNDRLHNITKDIRKKQKAEKKERRREEREYRKEAVKRKSRIMPQWLVDKILGLYGE